MPSVPTAAEVLGYFTSLSNWGRWGEDDRAGTVNLVDAERRAAAARLVRTGEVVSLSHRLDAAHPDVFGRASVFQRHLVKTGEAHRPEDPWTDGRQRFQATRDYVGVVAHGSHTHVDALAHASWDGRMYNGVPATEVTAVDGARTLDMDVWPNGVQTRGVLLDIAGLRGVDFLGVGDGVLPADLEAAERAQGVTVGPGDAVIVHTGNLARVRAQGLDADRGQSGYHAACLPWLRERDVAVVSSDSDNDVKPSGYDDPSLYVPIHAVGMVAMGLCLVDNLALTDLVALCRRTGRWEFFFVLQGLRVVGGTSSLVNPVAIF
jgi:kynurenine formamidase